MSKHPINLPVAVAPVMHAVLHSLAYDVSSNITIGVADCRQMSCFPQNSEFGEMIYSPQVRVRGRSDARV
eukprot:5165202-Pleurochrysis_carterae.AAC.1